MPIIKCQQKLKSDHRDNVWSRISRNSHGSSALPKVNCCYFDFIFCIFVASTPALLQSDVFFISDKYDQPLDTLITMLNAIRTFKAKISHKIYNQLSNYQDDGLETLQEYQTRWRSLRIIYFTMFMMAMGFSIVLTGVWPYLSKVY